MSGVILVLKMFVICYDMWIVIMAKIFLCLWEQNNKTSFIMVCVWWKENSGIRKQMSHEATTNLLQRQKNKWVCEGPINNSRRIPRTSPSHCETPQAGLVGTHCLPPEPLEDHLERHPWRNTPSLQAMQKLGINVREYTDLELPELLITARERGRLRTLAAAASCQSPRRPNKVMVLK